MTETEWLCLKTVREVFAGLPYEVSDRKIRLWAVACARLLVSPTSPTSRYQTYQNWLSDPGWAKAIEAAEDYADDLINRNTLRSQRDLTSGGPYNVFWAVAGVGHFSQIDMIRSISACAEEFGAPTLEEAVSLFRDVVGNPFRPVSFFPEWRTSNTVALVEAMYASRDFGIMPVLADALEEAGCDNSDILSHCRGSGPHVRGCWVVDLVLGKS